MIIPKEAWMNAWNTMRQPPPSALKVIGAGRLRGKSDINPQWRYEIMTDVFGPVGYGWKYIVNKIWTEDATDGQKFVFAAVSVYWRITDELWSDPIEGYGGSMLIQKEREGLHANDEGYKMAITDALGTAMKMLGVAADIYAGKWDGSKYNETPQDAPKKWVAPVKEELPRVDGMGNDLPDVPDFSSPDGGTLTIEHPLYGKIWAKIKETPDLDSEAFIAWLMSYKAGVDGAGKPRRPLLDLPDFQSMAVGDAEYLLEKWNTCMTAYLKSKIEK